jgi:hypothetical protein
MTCPRCSGLMVDGRWCDEGQWTPFSRCLLCGNITDALIRYNRRHQHEPGRPGRHRAYDPNALWERWLASRRPIATPPDPGTSTDRRA